MLQSNTVDDQPFLLVMQQIPFRVEVISPSANPEQLFYTGACTRGCVVTQLPERLIVDIYNTPSLFAHAYAFRSGMSLVVYVSNAWHGYL
jgi:hypothetical protein